MNRDFKGVWIPKTIYLNKELSWTEKILLIEIDSLDNDSEKGCFASNLYLSEFLGISEGTCANIISGLKSKNYIYQVFFDGRNRGLRLSDSFKNESRVHENMKAEFTKTLKQGSRKDEHINTVNNTVDVEEETTPPTPHILMPNTLDVSKNTIRYYYEKFMTTNNSQKEALRMSTKKTYKEIEIGCIGYVLHLLSEGLTMDDYKPDFQRHFKAWFVKYGADNLMKIDKDQVNAQFKKLNLYQDAD